MRSDYDMPWSDQAHLFVRGGTKVLSGQPLTTLDPIASQQGQKATTITKQKPIIGNSGQVIGVYVAVYKIAYHKAVNYSCIVDNNYINQFSSIDSAQKVLVINGYRFTKRESQCLFYLLRGGTAQTIAKKLFLSERTVEGYINAIKERLSCRTKSDLIASAINAGAISYIPENILLDPNIK